MRKGAGIPRDFFGEETSGAAPAARRQAPVDEAKVQVTIYLSERAALTLEKLRYELMLEHGVKASKSAIAQFAIEAASRDLEAMARALSGEGDRS